MVMRTSHIKCHSPTKTSVFKGGIQIDQSMTFGDASADTLTVTGTATFSETVTISATDVGIDLTGDPTTASIRAGTSGSPLTLAAHDDHIIDIYSTCASTNGSSSVRPIYMKSTMTGAGGVGGRAEFELYTNVELGGWANALKAHANFGSAGGITGLASAACIEMTLPDKDLGSGGVYAPLEIELTAGSSTDLSNGGPGGCYTAFMYMSANGTKTDLDDYGYLFSLQGLSKGEGHLFDDCTAGAASHALKINIGGTNYYIMLQDNVDA